MPRKHRLAASGNGRRLHVTLDGLRGVCGTPVFYEIAPWIALIIGGPTCKRCKRWAQR